MQKIIVQEQSSQIKQNLMPECRTILFDLDGTLIDHFSAIHRSVAYAQNRLGLPQSDYDTVRATVGGSVPVTLGKLLGPEHVDAALPHFRAHFDEIMLHDVAVLPGAEWLLRELKARGLQLAVFTNKFGDHSRAVLAHLGLDQWLDDVIGTGHTPHRKPEPEFTRYALDRLDASADTTILVGDSPFDYQAAAGLMIPAYLVATGSHRTEQLAADTEAAGIFDDLFQLGQQLFDLKTPPETQTPLPPPDPA
ncbi:MAG: HAD family hydrolase [Verrucomicrobiota bacterium]